MSYLLNPIYCTDGMTEVGRLSYIIEKWKGKEGKIRTYQAAINHNQR